MRGVCSPASARRSRYELMQIRDDAFSGNMCALYLRDLFEMQIIAARSTYRLANPLKKWLAGFEHVIAVVAFMGAADGFIIADR